MPDSGFKGHALEIVHIIQKSIYLEPLAKLSYQEGIVIPGKRSATRNPVPLGAGLNEFWIPASAGMTG